MHWLSLNRFSSADMRRLRHKSSTSSESSTSRMGLLRLKRRGGSEELFADSKQPLGTEAPLTAPWRIQNILKAPPSASEWWEEATHPSEDADNEESESQNSTEQLMKSSTSEESESRRFQNCGYDAWEKARTEWREPTVTSFPSKPPPVRRAQVIRGITSGKRQYELPGRMTLTDMINVYTDVWAAENGR